MKVYKILNDEQDATLRQRQVVIFCTPDGWNAIDGSYSDLATELGLESVEVTFQDDLSAEPRTYTEEEIASIKAAKIAELKAAADAEAESFISSYPAFERLSWPIQQTESNLWFSTEESLRTPELVPWCAGCASDRGIELSSFMSLVKANYQAFSLASSSIAGKRQRLSDAVTASTTVEAVLAITW